MNVCDVLLIVAVLLAVGYVLWEIGKDLATVKTRNRLSREENKTVDSMTLAEMAAHCKVQLDTGACMQCTFYRFCQKSCLAEVTEYINLEKQKGGCQRV